ncbi:MAG: type III-B CRISPR module-associated protein Cmr5 [Myxococcales bacterium]|nr:type III-B CRISPR module-associated protein Cmr5 [Myxococcota bacterium]MDW8283217.1 type III-B CRISPR module-associated protein Cmr5 [Myxococcales bacterium]
MSNQRGTLARQRERFALAQVKSWDRSWAKDAMTWAQSLPIQIRTQGLSQTVAWLLRVDTAEAVALAQLLAEWLLKESRALRPLGEAEQPSGRLLLERCIQADRVAYLAAQAEALAVLEPVKLLARVFYDEDNAYAG